MNGSCRGASVCEGESRLIGKVAARTPSNGPKSRGVMFRWCVFTRQGIYVRPASNGKKKTKFKIKEISYVNTVVDRFVGVTHSGFAFLAVQPRLGVLPQRRFGTGLTYHSAFTGIRNGLNRSGKP